MSFLDRLFGRNRSQDYDEGMALLEADRFAEAAAVLRRATGGGARARSDALGGNLLRRALVGEGRRLVRIGCPAEGLPFLAEASSLWPDFPDLHWWHGVAYGLAGDWNAALREAQTALRLNLDYAEARCLQAAALQNLGRGREAASALGDLVESGRRNDHWLVLHWNGPFAENALPADLQEVLGRLVSGETEKEQLASAVALCRAGHWDDGIAAFGELAARRPQYPDYRTRLAAALFQVNRNDEALQAVEAALRIHPSYRLAIDLKALILADQGAYIAAWDFLQRTEDQHDRGKSPNAHEALFGAYLRGVLTLLLGRPEQVAPLLGGWSELGKNFAWAEVLLAAAEDLRGQHTIAARRLEGLCQEWPAEPDYVFLLACHQLAAGRLGETAETLQRWPREGQPGVDPRPLFLQSQLQLRQGRPPQIPGEAEAFASKPDSGGADQGRLLPGPEAWELLRAGADFLGGKDSECWARCEKLARAGLVSERSLRIQIQAAAGAGKAVPDGWRPPGVVPDSCLPGAFHLALSTGHPAEARSLVRNHAALHPDSLLGVWLRPEFWLEPVRGWIA